MDEKGDKMFDFGVALTKFCTDYANTNGLLLYERSTHLSSEEITISLKAGPATHGVESAAETRESPKVRKHNMSQENRLRASDRMKTLWASGKIHGRPRLIA